MLVAIGKWIYHSLEFYKLKKLFCYFFWRWFHDGCCECVGSTCINYGVNESRCRNCPESKDLGEEFDDALDEDMQDYGDNMGPFDGSVNSNY